MVQRASLIGETVWKRMMRGLSTRNYNQIVQEFAHSYGIEKSRWTITSSKPAKAGTADDQDTG